MKLKKLFFLVKIEGWSGFPFLIPGKNYLATSLGKIKEGDFVIFKDQIENKFLVKKVISKEKEGYRVADFGIVPKKEIEGKLIFVKTK